MRSDRVMRRPTPSLKEYALAYPQGGRPPRHGKEFRLRQAGHLARPETRRRCRSLTGYGTAARDGLGPHPPAADPPAPRGSTTPSELPIIEGTLIRLQVDRLPGDADPLPLWLWSSATAAAPARTSTFAGRHSCAGSTSNTPSG